MRSTPQWPTLAGNAVVVRREFSQKIQMMLAPRDDIVEIVARRDGHAGQQKKHFSQGIGDLCLLKSRKGREGLEIFGHDHNSCRPRSAPGKTIASTGAADSDKTAPNFQQRNKSELRVPAPF
jgi:hypothetical protein